MIGSRTWAAIGVVSLGMAACQEPQVKAPAATGAAKPIPGPAWFQARLDHQTARAKGSPAWHDFSFSDRSATSGITFANPIVDDAGIEHKAVHYDHGTAVAAADVDGDGLPDLYFASQRGPGALYRNLGDGRFEDVTVPAGVAIPDAIAVGAAFADSDNDGDPDLLITTVRHGNRLFENQGGRFRDITKSAGVGYLGHSSGAVFFDYDRDGRLDLFVANVGVYTSDQRGAGGYFIGLADAFFGHLHPERAEASILYRNLGHNRFEDVTRKTGLVDQSWSGDATPFDANGDGWLDLYLLNMQGANHLWLNQGGRRFRDHTKEFFSATPWGAMGVKSFDYDGDGKLDLLVTDMHSDMHTNIRAEDIELERRKVDSAAMKPKFFPEGRAGYLFGNALFVNRGTRYEDLSDSAGVENYWPWGPSVDDFNADGWDDIFIASSMNFPYRYAPNALLLNEAGHRFLPSEFLLGIEPRPTGATEKLWFTLDCNGADANHLFCIGCARPGVTEPSCGPIDQTGHRKIWGTLGSRSAVILDLDGDGDLDLVTQEFNSEPRVLVSDLSVKRAVHWLAVVLQGTKSNRSGIGARVTVVLPDGRRLLKAMDGKSGYLAQSLLPLYFGLADSDRAASIEIEWPNGTRQTVAGPIVGNRRMEIVEP